MTTVKKLFPIVTGVHQYDKSLSTLNRGVGQIITAPILTYLIETSHERILFDVGCDIKKITQTSLKNQYFNPDTFFFGPPEIPDSMRLTSQLQNMGYPDIDLIFLSHLHFDHAGGLCDFCDAKVHVQKDELSASAQNLDPTYFDDEVIPQEHWLIKSGEYGLVPGVWAISTPGHTAGHMSLMIDLPKGKPIILAGDAADLQENIDDEIAPGICWQNQSDLAIASIQKLKRIARETEAEIWPNHDMSFWQSLKKFPAFYE